MEQPRSGFRRGSHPGREGAQGSLSEKRFSGTKMIIPTRWPGLPRSLLSLATDQPLYSITTFATFISYAIAFATFPPCPPDTHLAVKPAIRR